MINNTIITVARAVRFAGITAAAVAALGYCLGGAVATVALGVPALEEAERAVAFEAQMAGWKNQAVRDALVLLNAHGDYYAYENLDADQVFEAKLRFALSSGTRKDARVGIYASALPPQKGEVVSVVWVAR